MRVVARRVEDGMRGYAVFVGKDKNPVEEGLTSPEAKALRKKILAQSKEQGAKTDKKCS